MTATAPATTSNAAANLLEKGYYGSPRWSWEILDCAMPMTFDTYSNCAFQCLYCFSFFQRAIGAAADDYLNHRVRAVNVERVKRMFTDPDQYAGQFAWYIKARHVLQWGGLSDGLDHYERRLGKTLELLRFFREIDYPISISTKGTWWLDDPRYMECFTNAPAVQIKISIITMNEADARAIERAVVSPEERMRALGRLKKAGVGCATTRFRPYIIGVSNKTVRDIFRRSHEEGVDSLTTEFLCLEGRSSRIAAERFRKIGVVAGMDLMQFYRNQSFRKSGLLRLNYEVKRPYITEMEELAAKYDLPFFVSDAHHKEKCAGAGCCGLPKTGPLSNYARGQFTNAMVIAKKNGSVRWSDIAPLAEGLKNIPWSFANGYNTGDTQNRAKRYYQTMFDFMHSEWNDIHSANSPARYFGGVLVPGDIDEQGDIIYLYHRSLVQIGKAAPSVAALKDDLAAHFRIAPPAPATLGGGEGGC